MAQLASSLDSHEREIGERKEYRLRIALHQLRGALQVAIALHPIREYPYLEVGHILRYMLTM